ncbi:hypothetical protein OROHE_016821 [Orobanche hederae]
MVAPPKNQFIGSFQEHRQNDNGSEKTSSGEPHPTPLSLAEETQNISFSDIEKSKNVADEGTLVQNPLSKSLPPVSDAANLPRSGILSSSPAPLVVDLGHFLFLEASVAAKAVLHGSIIPSPTKTLVFKDSRGRASTASGSEPETYEQQAAVPGGGTGNLNPADASKLLNGSIPENPISSQILEDSSVPANKTVVFDFSSNPIPACAGGANKKSHVQVSKEAGILNLMKDPVSLKIGPQNPMSDLRGSVPSNIWARYLDVVWNDATVIVYEILKYSASDVQNPALEPPVATPAVKGPQADLGSLQIVAPVPAPGIPKSFADAVSSRSAENPAVVDGSDSHSPIGQTNFSRGIPTAIFSKEDGAQVSSFFKFALIGKFSYGKPDSFEISSEPLNN